MFRVNCLFTDPGSTASQTGASGSMALCHPVGAPSWEWAESQALSSGLRSIPRGGRHSLTAGIRSLVLPPPRPASSPVLNGAGGLCVCVCVCVWVWGGLSWRHPPPLGTLAEWVGGTDHVVPCLSPSALAVCFIFPTVVVQLLSCVRLSATPRTTVRQALYPSLSPGVCSDSCPLSRWCSLTISSPALLLRHSAYLAGLLKLDFSQYTPSLAPKRRHLVALESSSFSSGCDGRLRAWSQTHLGWAWPSLRQAPNFSEPQFSPLLKGMVTLLSNVKSLTGSDVRMYCS